MFPQPRIIRQFPRRGRDSGTAGSELQFPEGARSGDTRCPSRKLLGIVVPAYDVRLLLGNCISIQPILFTDGEIGIQRLEVILI